jgi:DNA-binding IclR family transcriptional regulator
MRHPYLVESVVRAARVLAAFSRDEALTLSEIQRRIGLSRSIVFRLVYTLERCGLMERTPEGLHRLGSRRAPRSLLVNRLTQTLASAESIVLQRVRLKPDTRSHLINLSLVRNARAKRRAPRERSEPAAASERACKGVRGTKSPA